MPNTIRPADAFRRATKEIETRQATANAGVFENFLIREVFANRDCVQRNIVVEIRQGRDWITTVKPA